MSKKSSNISVTVLEICRGPINLGAQSMGQRAWRQPFRPACRLTLIYRSMDDTDLQRQDYLMLRAGTTVFKILVQGPEAERATISALLDHLLASLAVGN